MSEHKAPADLFPPFIGPDANDDEDNDTIWWLRLCWCGIIQALMVDTICCNNTNTTATAIIMFPLVHIMIIIMIIIIYYYYY